MTWTIANGSYATEDIPSDTLTANSSESINVTVLAIGTIYFDGASNSPFPVNVTCI